jgi:pyocin large subunit-like protein
MRIIIVFFLGMVGLAVYPSFQHQATAPVAVQGSIQGKATSFAPGQLQAHYLKHGHQFGSITEEDYLINAQKLLNAPVNSDLLEKTQKDGDIARYKPSTREFAVMTPSGRIRTYFKASDSYWNMQ